MANAKIKIERHCLPWPKGTQYIEARIKGATEYIYADILNGDLYVWCLVNTANHKARTVRIWLIKEQSNIPANVFRKHGLIHWRSITHRLYQVELEFNRMRCQGNGIHLFVERKDKDLISSRTIDERIPHYDL